MDYSTTQGSTSNTSAPSAHTHSSENATPARYTCYDTATFLALIIVVATTRTVDVADEAFEQAEKESKAHRSIEITNAHHQLARRPSRKVRRCTGADQAGAEKRNGRMRSHIGKWLDKVVQSLKAEQ